jgi:thermitase
LFDLLSAIIAAPFESLKKLQTRHRPRNDLRISEVGLMKRMIIAICVATLLTLVLTSSPSLTGARAQKTIDYRAFDQAKQFVPGRVLVKFRSGIMPDHARQIIAALGTREIDEIAGIGVHVLELPYQASENAFADTFHMRPEVEFAELDRILPLQQMVPNDPLYDNPNSWSLPKINAPEAWAINTGSSDIVVAILDTGVDASHPELAPKIVPGWNIYDNNADTSDIYGHGTAVAGTAAASSNNSVGVASVAWGCRIMPVRISDSSGYGSYSNIASGLNWAADHGARVANISYDVSGSRTVSSAAKYFQAKGGVVASAAGNQGISSSTGDDPYILTVGATDSSDSLFSWSNRGNNLDLVAPGNVYTTLPGGLYGVGGGTSFASPIVAGAAALVLSVNPNLTPGQVQDILKQGADDLGLAGWDSNFGSGRINVGHALSLALVAGGGVDTTPPAIGITTPAAGSMVAGSVSVTVNAVDNVQVTKVALYVDGALYASSMSAPFTIKWNTRKATSGAHSLQSRAYDAAGNAGVSSEIAVYK